MVGRVVRDIHRQAPGLRRARRRRRLHRRDRGRGRGRGRDGDPPSRTTSASAARCSRATSTRFATTTTSPSRSTATASTSPSTCRRCSRRCRPAGEKADMVYGSRFRGDPGYKVPLGRRVGNLIFSVVLTVAHPPEDHRPDLGLSDDQPARDRALRPRLPARLPRGRGDPDAARPPPAHPRGPRADERARLRRRARSTTRAAPTTWSRCCWPCSSASSAAARPRSRRPARTSSGVGPPAEDRHDALRRVATRGRRRRCSLSRARGRRRHARRSTTRGRERARLARRDDPRGRAGRHDRAPAGHLPARPRATR